MCLKLSNGLCRLFYMPLCTFLFCFRPFPEEYAEKLYSTFSDTPILNWGLYMLLLVFLGELTQKFTSLVINVINVLWN